MKHATLYRKWRPRAFSGISGQEPVVRTLRRAIETGRVAHAYLFSGPRGTGKTSTAKVLAMGLNCERGPTPEPDGTCESCRGIINNSSLDVVEMDAASNRGIDEIRELRDRVNLAPAAGRMKVYIIDEVHMLTTEAFNALLKMLEEPPEHVVFVLATTEKHKVLPTIVSRCQSFDFRRPGVGTLADKLAEISAAEGIEAEPEALTVIARAGGGSFRDAEGLLDQLSSFADGPVTAAMVRELLGGVGSEVLLEATGALHERRAADALRILDRLSNEGKDLGQFAAELLGHLRRLMLLPHAPEIALADVGADERAPLEEQANRVPTAGVVRMIEVLGDAAGRARRGGDPKLELELTFLKLARDYAEPSVDALMARLEELERAVQNGAVAPAVGTAPPERPAAPEPFRKEESDQESWDEADEADAGAAEDEPVDAQEPEAGDVPEPEPEDTELEGAGGEAEPPATPDIAGSWASVVQDLRLRRQVPAAAVYEEARVEGFDGRTLLLAYPEELGIYAKLARDARHADPLLDAVEHRFGFRPRLESQVAGRAPEAAQSSRTTPEQTSDRTPERPVAEPRPEPQPAMPDSLNTSAPEAAEERSEDGNGTRTGVPAEPEARPEAEGGDGIIRDQREVFALARERFGTPDGGGN